MPKVTTNQTIAQDLRASLHLRRGRMSETTDALEVASPDGPKPRVLDLTPAHVEPLSPLPVFRGQQMVEALTAYRELQAALDRAMPDQLMQLDGKPFRKKGYWRALSVAFNLTVEPVYESREVNGQFTDGRDNFGYVVTYRATAPNGRTITGDGACFAVEKAKRFKCPHPHPRGWKGKTEHFPAESCPDFDPDFQWRTLPGQATEHNIRSHAHTRAFNRAVSNLVGFGEVSAEEVERDQYVPDVETYEVTPPIVRIKLPEGAVQLLSVKPQRHTTQTGAVVEWADVTYVTASGVEHTLPTPADGKGAAVGALEQLVQDAVPVWLVTKVTPRSKKTVIIAAHRKPPSQDLTPEEHKALDAQAAAQEAF